MQGTRRAFLKLAGASALAGSGGSLSAPWARNAKAQPLGDLPNFDGDVLFDEAARNVAGVDFGTGIRRAPAAVLRPRSVDDIIRIAAYANKTGRKIAMRGQGHSLYGQAQAEGGIIVDSSTLNAIRAQGDNLLDAQSGVLWGDAARVAFSRTRMPPVMVDALMLSVGGTLSVGGIGETSYREGCQVDHVSELDVVTATERSRHLLAGPQRRTVPHDARRPWPMRDHRPSASSSATSTRIRRLTHVELSRPADPGLRAGPPGVG
jgi:cytokinin dehydrogenase